MRTWKTKASIGKRTLMMTLSMTGIRVIMAMIMVQRGDHQPRDMETQSVLELGEVLIIVNERGICQIRSHIYLLPITLTCHMIKFITNRPKMSP